VYVPEDCPAAPIKPAAVLFPSLHAGRKQLILDTPPLCLIDAKDTQHNELNVTWQTAGLLRLKPFVYHPVSNSALASGWCLQLALFLCGGKMPQ